MTTKRVIVLHGDKSPRTHYPGCEWAIAQEHNHHIRWHRRDSTRPEDADWFKQRQAAKQLATALGKPLPHCTYCNCDI